MTYSTCKEAEHFFASIQWAYCTAPLVCISWPPRSFIEQMYMETVTPPQ